MTQEASIPGPSGRPSACDADPLSCSLGLNSGSLSDDDLLALLDSLGIEGTHEPEAEQEAVAAVEWRALQTSGDGGAVSPVAIGEQLPAGPSLAAVLSQYPPGEGSDWDLPGMASSYRRLAAWAQARELAAVAEIAARRAATNPAIGADETGRPSHLPPEAAAEVALELRMTQAGASAWTDLGCQLRWQLARTGAALAAGSIDLARARIIAEGTSLLTDEHVALVEDRVLSSAGNQTIGQLRTAVRRAVMAVDPDGAEQRRNAAERRAKISLYPGEEGTATLTGSSLPGVQAAAAMARITAIARALKSSGAHGGLDLLRAHVFIGLLLGTLPLIPPPADGPPDNPASPGRPPDNPAPPGGPPDNPASPGEADGGDEPPSDDSQPADLGVDHGGTVAGPVDSACGADLGRGDDLPGWWPDIPCPTDADAPPPDMGHPPDPPAALNNWFDDEDDDWPQLPPPDWPPLPACLPAAFDTALARRSTDPPSGPARTRAGLLDVLLPWSSLTGGSSESGLLGRIGPVTSLQAQQLLVLAARSPTTEWRIVVTNDDGRATAVERARLRRTAQGGLASTGVADANVTGVIGRVTISARAGALGTVDDSDCPPALRGITTAILAAARRATARADAEAALDAEAGGCAHTTASAAYRPPPRIREFIAARDKTCRFGTCGQPAWRTDIDHTRPWHKGGPTCRCNLGGCCRTHHKIKQLPGWRLEQPQPGVFCWTTPAGRSHWVQPDPYPV